MIPQRTDWNLKGALALKRSSILIRVSLSKHKGYVVCRLAAIAAFTIFLVLPLWAQRGVGGGGRLAGGAGIGRGRISSGHPSSTMQGRSGSSPGFSHHPSTLPDHSHGMSGNRFQTYRKGRNRFRNCYGYSCWGYGYPWWGYSYPYWWESPDSAYDPNDDVADQMNQEIPEDQRMPRQWQGYSYPDPYAPPPPRAPHSASSESQGAAIIPATVLVFHDQHKLEIRNYAIFGRTLWNFLPQHIEKISLNELDLAATIKANDERGLSFRVPSDRQTSIDAQQVQNNI
jgi:hypothetical protein